MNPSADDSFVTWSGSVDSNPQPISVKVRPIQELFEQRYLGRYPAMPGEEPAVGVALWTARKANLQQAMKDYLTRNGIRYIEYLKDAVPVYLYAGARPVPGYPGVTRSLGTRLGIVAPTGPQGASWESMNYVCMAFKNPNADCVPVNEYRHPATEGYRYRIQGSPGPGWESVGTVFYAPKTQTNYSHAIHGWGFDGYESQYQTKGDSPPIGTYWQSKPLPGGGEGAWSEQRPMEDYGVIFNGVSTRIAAIS
jgi:MAC/Perforin domain